MLEKDIPKSLVITAYAYTAAAAVPPAAAPVPPRLPRRPVAVPRDVARAPLALPVVELLVVGDGLALVQDLEAVLVDGREVDEDVLAAVLGGDEPEPLVAEELDYGMGGRCGRG